MQRVARRWARAECARGRGALRSAQRFNLESLRDAMDGEEGGKERRLDNHDRVVDNQLPNYAFADPPTPFHRQRHHNFIDRVTFVAKGGDGGHGGIYWYRFFNNPAGGPAGGNGGNGGDVMGQCAPQYEGFTHLITDGYIVFDPYNEKETTGVCAAGMGTNGDRSGMEGNFGHPIVLPLPQGTVVIDADTGRELVEFSRIGETFVFAKGGVGGRGNEEIANSIMTAPDYGELGHNGEAKTFTLELRQVADVAMIGPPNSGKSSLLGAVSRAAPEPSASKFTTWRPNVGMIRADETTEFSMVDLPPLEKNAHTGTTEQSHDFLKHARRCHSLLYVIDVTHHLGGDWKKPAMKDSMTVEGAYKATESGTLDIPDEVRHIDMKDALKTLQNELDFYQEGMSHKAIAIAVTKMDLLHDPYTLEETWKKVEELQASTNLPVFPLSAHTKKGCLDLMLYLSKMSAKAQRDATDYEQERSKLMSAPQEALNEMRLAETKQIMLQKAQDFHLARAVETVLEERIRGRENYQARQQGDIELARQKVYDPHPDLNDVRGPPEPEGDALRLADVEREDTAPFVRMEDMVDEVNSHPEDWAGGGMEDMREDRRTETYRTSELFNPLNYELTRKEVAERAEERETDMLIDRTVAMEKELARKEYSVDLIGTSGAVTNIDAEELAQRNEAHLEAMREAVKERTRLPAREKLPLPLLSDRSGEAVLLEDGAPAAPPRERDNDERLPPYRQLQAEEAAAAAAIAARKGPPLRPLAAPQSMPALPGAGARPDALDTTSEEVVEGEGEKKVPAGPSTLSGGGLTGGFIDPAEKYHVHISPEALAEAAREIEEGDDGYEGGEHEGGVVKMTKAPMVEPKEGFPTTGGRGPLHGRQRVHAGESYLYERPSLRNAHQEALDATYQDENRPKMRASPKMMMDGIGRGRSAPMSPAELAAFRENAAHYLRPDGQLPPEQRYKRTAPKEPKED